MAEGMTRLLPEKIRKSLSSTINTAANSFSTSSDRDNGGTAGNAGVGGMLNGEQQRRARGWGRRDGDKPPYSRMRANKWSEIGCRLKGC